MLKKFFNNTNLGLLLIRILLGLILIVYGVSYLKGGASAFQKLGEQTSAIGFTFAYPVLGFLGMLVFSIGGFCLILGFLFRWICFIIFIMMLIATVYHYNGVSLLFFDLKTPHCLTAAAIAFAFIFIGPGAWSIDGDS